MKKEKDKESYRTGSEDIDDEVIVLEGDNQDDFS